MGIRQYCSTKSWVISTRSRAGGSSTRLSARAGTLRRFSSGRLPTERCSRWIWTKRRSSGGRSLVESFGSRLTLAKANFKDIFAVAQDTGFLDVDGILADIGVSSMMLDDPERGFSFMREGPLDMRMDRSQELTAADIVNTYGEKEIADILYMYGEERRSRPIARSIVRSRPLATTFDLGRAVERVLGGPRYGQIHPATRTFQALRIAVNEELDNLQVFLNSAPTCLRPGGRLAVITFHSLEDRIVKNAFRASAIPGKPLTKKVITATAEEVHSNSRAQKCEVARMGEKSCH